MEVQSNGIIYYVNKEVNETPEMLASRAWFIASKSPMNMEDYLRLYRLSIFKANVIFLGCKYPAKIMNQLDIPKKTVPKLPPIYKRLPRENRYQYDKNKRYGNEGRREFKTDL